MRWSREPYDAGGGMVLEGDAAAAMRCLDELDPTAPGAPWPPARAALVSQCAAFLAPARWCAELGQLLAPAGTDTWESSGEGRLADLLATFLSARAVWGAREAARHPDEPRCAAFAKAAARDDSGALRAVLPLVEQRLSVDAAALDADPDMLGTPQGVYRLDAGALVSEEEHYLGEPIGSALRFMVTKRTGAPVDSALTGAAEPYDERWDAFVDQVTDGDSSLASFLQRALGYCLRGDNREKASFFLWSRRRNCGKSTLMSIVKAAMGDYAGAAPVEMLLAGGRMADYSSPNPVLLGLRGKRLVDMSEPPVGAELDGAALKRLTSGADGIVARGLHRDPVEFVPALVPWMHCNALPVVRDATAIDPRLAHVVEFARSFEGEARDFGLVGRFTTRRGMATVMRWLLDGYSDYLSRGLAPPARVRAASEAWLTVSGTWIDEFVAALCVLGPGERTALSEMRAAMEAYRESVGGERMPARAVDAYLARLNVPNTTSHGTRIYRGIGLKGDARERLLPPGERDGAAGNGRFTLS